MTVKLTPQEQMFVQLYGKALNEGGTGRIVGQDQKSVICFTKIAGNIVVTAREYA